MGLFLNRFVLHVLCDAGSVYGGVRTDDDSDNGDDDDDDDGRKCVNVSTSFVRSHK